jgi:SpoVK/Ycf46/Vps4 family AAA+-type ATPase
METSNDNKNNLNLMINALLLHQNNQNVIPIYKPKTLEYQPTQTNYPTSPIKSNDHEHNAKVALESAKKIMDSIEIDMQRILIREKLAHNLLSYSRSQLPEQDTHEQDVGELFHIEDSINNITDLINISKKYCNDERRISIDKTLLKNIIEPMEVLNNVIGMDLVKEQIVDQIISSLQDLYTDDQRFHTVIQGPPGVGKSMLAKMIGHIYLNMGILKNNNHTLNFISAKRSDLIGKFLGHTAKLTQAMIDKAEGGVLFIDEVYSLGNNEKKDNFSKECIDVINYNLIEKKNFVCIIAGYSQDIDECFFSYNAGLKRRFPFVYEINGYNSNQMADILIKKIIDSDWTIDPNIKSWLYTFIDTHIDNFPNFAGDIDTLLLNTKTCHGRRIFGKDPSIKKIITKTDVLLGYDKYIGSSNLKDQEPEQMDCGMMYT